MSTYPDRYILPSGHRCTPKKAQRPLPDIKHLHSFTHLLTMDLSFSDTAHQHQPRRPIASPITECFATPPVSDAPPSCLTIDLIPAVPCFLCRRMLRLAQDPILLRRQSLSSPGLVVLDALHTMVRSWLGKARRACSRV